MSLFRDEYHTVNLITFDPYKIVSGLGTGGIAGGSPEGTIWYDSVTRTFQTLTASGQSGIAITPSVQTIAALVSNTNATTATALNLYAFKAAQLNAVGKTVYFYGAGNYTTDGGTARTVTLALTQGDGTNTRTLMTFTTAVTTASQTALPWNVDGFITTQASGTAGTMFAHGSFNIALGTTAVTTSYNDLNTAATSALDLTKVNTLTVTQLFSGSNAGNIFVQDTMIVQILN
jgi:hypothetical protein